jgi:TM2 domain-containing membrane protein YozV
MRDSGLGVILRLSIPSVGQFYNGCILPGLLWLVPTPGLWIGTGSLLGGAFCIVSAYTGACDHRVRT